MSNLNLLCKLFSKIRVNTVTQVRYIRHPYVVPKFQPPHWYERQERVKGDELLTQDNKEFLEEYKKDKLRLQNESISPLLANINGKQVEWAPYMRRVGLIARKIGNYPLWSKEGKLVSSTLVQIVDNHVIKYIPPELFKPMKENKPYWKEKETRGCLLVGAETVDPSTVTKEYAGLFNSVGMLPKRRLVRFMIHPQAELPTGTPLLATHFRVGDYLDIRAKTMDRGFQGVMKRWGFKGMPASHGVTKTHRRPGNIGAGGQKARVWPGTKMPGHMGNRWRMFRGAKILRMNTRYNVLWLQGYGIPGQTGSYCYLYDTILPTKRLKTPPPFPTQPPVDDLPLEYYDESIHHFEDDSIKFDDN